MNEEENIRPHQVIILDGTPEEIILEEKSNDESSEKKEPPPPEEGEPGFIGPLRRPKRKKREVAKGILRELYIILRQILEDYGSRIFLLLIMVAALQLGDVIGFIYLTITVIIMVSEIRTNWNHGWVSYALVSFVVFGFQIYFIAANNLREVTRDTATWLGFALTGGKSVGVFILNFFIFLVSILLGLFLRAKRITLTDKQYIEIRNKFRPILHDRIREYRMNDLRGGFSSVMQAEEENEIDLEELRKEFKVIRMQYYYQKVRRFFRRSYHRHGFDFALFFLVVLALYDLSILSIVYLLIATYFAFNTSIFFEEAKGVKKLKRLQWQWRIIYFLMALNFMRQYFFSIWFPLSWDINRLLIDADFNCDPNSRTIYSILLPYSKIDDYRTCVDSWRLWFTLDVASTRRLYIYFFTLVLMILYDKYFYPINNNEQDYVEGDDLDFTNPNNRRLIDHMRFYYYCYFYLIPLVMFVGIGIRLNITGQTDLIGLIYFFLGLYLLLNYRKLLRKKNRTWVKIEILNIIILMLIIVFQIPAVPCPLVVPNRAFLSQTECIEQQVAASTVNANTLNRINSIKNWYVVVDIIGINKIARISFSNSYKEILMIIFFFLAIVQRKIWQHPYVKAYVTPFYEKKNKYNHQIGAKYIERIHLKRIVSHRMVLLDKALAVHTERKIENKLKGWESMFDKFSLPIREKEEEEPMEERRLVGQDELTEKCYRIIDEVANECPESKILHVEQFEDLVRRCRYNKKTVMREVYKEIKQEKIMVLRSIRNIKELNLPTKLGTDLVVVGLNLTNVQTPFAANETTDRKDGQQDLSSTPESLTKLKVDRNTEEDKEQNMLILNKVESFPIPEQLHEEEKKEDEEQHHRDYERDAVPNTLRISQPVKRKLDKLKTLAVEEVLLEAENPRGSLNGLDQREIDMSPARVEEAYYGIDFGVKRKRSKRRRIIDKINLWLVKQIRSSSLIGDVQAGLLVGENTVVLLLKLIFVNMDKITFLMFLFNHLENSNVLSVVFPLSMLLYGALEYPLPPARYWKIMMVYTVLLLVVKFLYQSPFFCGTPSFSWNNIFDDNYGCTINYSEPWYLSRRVDYVIGIHKFTGDSSYPVNQGLAGGLAWDLVVFFCMILVRFAMDSAGIWNHMRIYNNFTYVPQLGDPLPQEYNVDYSPSKLKKRERRRFKLPCRKRNKTKDRDNKDNNDYEKPAKRKWITPKAFFKNMFSVNPYVNGEATVRKPGANMYVFTAPLSLIILIYFIFFFSQILGSSRSIQEELNQALFSGGVVVAIVVIIMLMLLERILFISRENIFQRAVQPDNLDETVNDTKKPKHKKKARLSRRFILKIVLHFVMVLGMNGFFLYVMINSHMTEDANNYGYIYIGYLLCAFYLYASAQQIRFGYPVILDTRVFHSFDPIVVLLFKLYRAVPFLYEITSILDWTISPTSLALYEWMRVEEAYSNLYLIKNSMRGRESRITGENRGKWERFTSGFILVFVLVFVIILPILLFSSLNPSTDLNNIISGTVSVELQAVASNSSFRFTLYQVQNILVQSLTEDEVNSLDTLNPDIGSYDYEQVQKIRIPTYSENEWLISLPSLDQLNQLLEDDSVPFYIVANWYFNRENPRDGAFAQGLAAKVVSDTQKSNLRSLLQIGAGRNSSIVITSLFPRYLAITRLSYTYLLGPQTQIDVLPFNTDVALTFNNDTRGRYWTLTNYRTADKIDPLFGPGNQVSIFVASDQALASFLASVSALGVVGFFVTITLAVGRIVRGMFAGNFSNVIYDELPVPDDLIELCDSIYLARKEGNHYKEEKLYYILVRILRSPEMLIELTGPFPIQQDPVEEKKMAQKNNKNKKD